MEITFVDVTTHFLTHGPKKGIAGNVWSLARRFNISFIDIEIETAPIEEDSFEFDFESVLRRLDAVLSTNRVSGKQVVEKLMTVVDRTGWPPSFVLYREEGLEVKIAPHFVQRRTSANPWSADGAILRGKLIPSSEERGAYETPTILITIYDPQSVGSFGLPLIIRDHKKGRAVELRDQILFALSRS